jgi:aerotaxis receptor
MLGLDSIRVLCRVEAGRMSGGAEGLQAIIKTLDRFHADVASKLNRIQDLARRIRASAEAAARAER